MRYVYLKNNPRSREEQWYIQATMEAWKYLPEKRKTELRELIGSVSEDAREQRALYDHLVRRIQPEVLCAREGIGRRRFFEMREDFYQQFVI